MVPYIFESRKRHISLLFSRSKDRLQRLIKQFRPRDFQRQTPVKYVPPKRAEFIRHLLEGASFNSYLGLSSGTEYAEGETFTHIVPAHQYSPRLIENIIYGYSNVSLNFARHSRNQRNVKPRLFHVKILEREFHLELPIEELNKIGQIFGSSSSDMYSAVVSQEKLKTDFKISRFLAQMPAWAHRVIPEANPEDLVNRLLPESIVPERARHIATCFWSFLCVVDDLTEDGGAYDCIESCVESLSTVNALYGTPTLNHHGYLFQELSETSKLDECTSIMEAFQTEVNNSKLLYDSTEEWRTEFWSEVLQVIKALQAEKYLHGRKFSMQEWLQLRLITISARPFMVLLRVSLGLPSALESTPVPQIKQIQGLVQAALGLQNDLLGWQKDHIEENAMNAVEVLIGEGNSPNDAFLETLDAHNGIVRCMLSLAEISCLDESWVVYVKTIVSFCNAMAEWMLSSKRYQT